jgi:hypothetical protein
MIMDMDKQAVEKVWDNLAALKDSLADLAGTGEARRHFIASRREALLGFSALLGRAAECCEPAGTGQKQTAAAPVSQSIEIGE